MYQKKLASRIIIYNEDYYNTRIFKEKNMLALIWYNERCPLINKRLSFDFNIFVIEWLSPCGKEESTRKCVVESMRRADNQFDGYQEEKRLTSHSFKSIWIVLLTLNWMREQIRKRACRAHCKRYLYFSTGQCHRSCKATHLSHVTIFYLRTDGRRHTHLISRFIETFV